MLAVVKTARGEGHVALVDRDPPGVPEGWVAIDVTYAGVCGTDLHILHDRFPYWPPVTMGHEFVGTVGTVGPGVDADLIATRVVAEPHSFACTTCFLCRRGFAELCPEKRSPGWGIDGAFAASLTLPAHLLHQVPDSVPDLVAAMAEPMAVAVTALSRGRVEAGDTVVVIGPGPVGILLAVAARSMGAENVVIVGRSDSVRLRFAEAIGLHTVLDGDAADLVAGMTSGRGADLVVDSTGTDAALALAIRVVRRRGRMVAVGLSGRDTISVPWDAAVARAIDVTFSMSSNATAWEPALGILAGTGTRLLPMVDVFPLRHWQDAFAAVESKSRIKILLDPNGN